MTSNETIYNLCQIRTYKVFNYIQDLGVSSRTYVSMRGIWFPIELEFPIFFYNIECIETNRIQAYLSEVGLS